ncbi:MAG: YggT family protein [Slackia sp.]|nr:YggT family protein [Slackia sp.]
MLEYLIVSLADVYTMILFVYVLMSWIPQKGGIIADIDTVLGKVCDPFLNLFRKFIPPIGGMVDISPIFALLVLQFAVRLIVGIL